VRAADAASGERISRSACSFSISVSRHQRVHPPPRIATYAAASIAIALAITTYVAQRQYASRLTTAGTSARTT